MDTISAGAVHKHTVLIIEVAKIPRDTYAEKLQQIGFRVLSAKNRVKGADAALTSSQATAVALY